MTEVCLQVADGAGRSGGYPLLGLLYRRAQALGEQLDPPVLLQGRRVAGGGGPQTAEAQRLSHDKQTLIERIRLQCADPTLRGLMLAVMLIHFTGVLSNAHTSLLVFTSFQTISFT
jgi:hypothetical protein